MTAALLILMLPGIAFMALVLAADGAVWLHRIHHRTPDGDPL